MKALLVLVKSERCVVLRARLLNLVRPMKFISLANSQLNE